MVKGKGPLEKHKTKIIRMQRRG